MQSIFQAYRVTIVLVVSIGDGADYCLDRSVFSFGDISASGNGKPSPDAAYLVRIATAHL